MGGGEGVGLFTFWMWKRPVVVDAEHSYYENGEGGRDYQDFVVYLVVGECEVEKSADKTCGCVELFAEDEGNFCAEDITDDTAETGGDDAKE